MDDRAEIYLVPGFLGFARLAGLDYYIGVGQLLQQQLDAIGIDATIHSTSTVAAGSLRKRAEHLAQEIADRHDADASSVHLIGHSTGGLDARVLLSPGSDLDAGHVMREKLGEEAFARYADALEKVRTAVSVATPNFGTPLANLGTRLSLGALLNAMSDAAKIPLIRGGLTVALRVAAPVVDLVQKLPIDTPLLDWIDAEVLSEDPQAVLRYLDGIGVDTGALRNLTQEGTDLANALLLDRPGVQYASVVTGTAPPAGRIDADDPLIYANTLFFRAAWGIAAQRNEDYAYAERNAELQERHETDRAADLDVGELSIDDRISDGIVASASQPHGEPLVVVASDHLDCVGHFPHTLPDGTEVSGWVRSGAGFNQDRFEIVWSRVARFVSRSLGG